MSQDLSPCKSYNSFMKQSLISTLWLPTQVIEWLDNHGEVFLSKNTAIGKSLQKANALHKNHEHFENVAQVSEL